MTKMYLTRNKRSYKLILHFTKPECIGGQSWVSDERAVQLNDNDFDITFKESPVEVEFCNKEVSMAALELFKKLPHLDYNKNVLIDWGYTPTLCHFDQSWHVSWIHCEEGDILIDFEAETPEEAIKKAFDWCVELKLIEK